MGEERELGVAPCGQRPEGCLHRRRSDRSAVVRKRLMGLTTTTSMDKISMNPGALGAEETRQSIPNLAVKLCCGDNTAGGALWEDSSAPGPPPQANAPSEMLSHLNFIFIFGRQTLSHSPPSSALRLRLRLWRWPMQEPSAKRRSQSDPTAQEWKKR